MRYTFVLSDLDDRALTWHVTHVVNRGRRAEGLPPYTDNLSYITDKVSELVKPVRAAYDEHDASAVATAYRAASVQTRAAAKSALGL